MHITSRQNPLIKDIAKLAKSSRLRRERNILLAEGIHLAREAVASGIKIQRFLCTTAMERHGEVAPLIAQARENNIKVDFMTEECYQRFSTLRNPEGLAVLAEVPSWGEDDLFYSASRLCILDGIQDPGNAGAIVRTAEAAGAGGVVLLADTVDPTHPAFVRAAMGSSFRLPLMAMDIDRLLAKAGEVSMRILVTASDGAVDYGSADYTPPVGLVIGSEGQGVGKNLMDAAKSHISIPMQGRVESLNAGVAAGVLLYEARRHW